MPQQMSTRQRRLRSLRRKQVRKNERNWLRNRSAQSAIKTSVRRLEEAIARGQQEQAVQQLRQVESLLDKAHVRGILPRNKVARSKARLNRQVQKAFTPQVAGETA